MVFKYKINSGQKRSDGVPANSAADFVNRGGFPLGHQMAFSRFGGAAVLGGRTLRRPVGVLAPSPPDFLRGVEPQTGTVVKVGSRGEAAGTSNFSRFRMRDKCCASTVSTITSVPLLQLSPVYRPLNFSAKAKLIDVTMQFTSNLDGTECCMPQAMNKPYVWRGGRSGT